MDDKITKYKSEIMKTLCSTADIVHLIPGFETASAPNRDLMYTHFFPFDNIDKCVTQTGQYICFDVDIGDTRTTKSLEYVIYFWLVSSTDIDTIRTDLGIRNDVLFNKIYEAMSANDNFGIGHITLAENNSYTRFIPADKFAGRQLILLAKDFNIKTKDAEVLWL